MSEGLRYDKGKLRVDLLPPEWIEALAAVTTAGANKYADRNWEKGMKWSRVLGPLYRHLLKWLQGERYDVGETECHHLAMVAWNALALMTYQIRQVGENDLVGKKEWNDLVTNPDAVPRSLASITTSLVHQQEPCCIDGQLRFDDYAGQGSHI